MKIENREYKLWDFIKIPFSVAPGLACLRIADKIVYASLPALQIVTTALFIDTALSILGGRSDGSRIVMPLAWIILLIAYKYFAFTAMGLLNSKMGIRLTEAFRTAVVEKRAALEYRHVEDNDTWDLISRVGADPAEKIGGGFDILLRMGDIILNVGSVLLILVVQVWWIALAIVGFSAPLLMLAVKSGKAHYDASKEAAKHARRAQYLQGVLTGRDSAEERALFGYSDELNKRYYEKYQSAYKINMKAQRKRYIRQKSASLTTIFMSILIAGVLIVPLGSGEISAGMFMGFVTATFGLAQSLSWELTYITGELANNREYLRDLTAFARLSETPGATDAPAANMPEPQRIEFRNVSFAYPGTRREVLKDLSITLLAGKHYAFVGENGAGKTTITKLLTGLYDNYTGDILIDGKNLREFTQPELKAMFSIVYQDFAKYQIRLADSVAPGKAAGGGDAVGSGGDAVGSGGDAVGSGGDAVGSGGDAGAGGGGNTSASGGNAVLRAVESALETLGLAEAVSKLPDGLDTPLGRIHENGADLSGGEWQRIAIARSLVNGAPVHILDEPAAALDPIAESALYKLFSEISAGKSTIFITHRLGAARLADKIFVIAGGRAAEQGAHGELMSANGLYAKMFEAQRGWYA